MRTTERTINPERAGKAPRSRLAILALSVAALALLALASVASAATPPEATTGGAWWSGPPSTEPSLLLAGLVNPQGEGTTYYFQYVTEKAFEESGYSTAATIPAPPGAEAGSGTENVVVEQRVFGLSPSTAYHYRLIAVNFAAPSGIDGADQAVVAPSASGRFYEMVSPLQKGGTEIEPIPGGSLPAAADGDAAGFASQSGFGDAENYKSGVFGSPGNIYISRRSEAGWKTYSALTPASVLWLPPFSGLAGDVSPEGFSSQVTCGLNKVTNFGEGMNLACAYRDLGGAWIVTPFFPSLGTQTFGGAGGGEMPAFQGESADHSRAFFSTPSEPNSGLRFLAADTTTGEGDAIYELSGLDTPSPALRLVNVEENGEEIGPSNPTAVGSNASSYQKIPDYGSYQAISENGLTVFFTATPTGGVGTVYARIDNSEPGAHTVAASNPSPPECTTCSSTPQPATYQGASRDGSRVFFTTTQQLANADTDSTSDLYSYDFSEPVGHHIVQLSAGGSGDATPGAGADVQGVVTTSEDGSHVYFVATGVLTTEANPTTGLTAQPGEDNLYAVDTETDATRFIATLAAADSTLWGASGNAYEQHKVQATPDGRYLAFQVADQLTPDDTDEAADVYRYDFQSGELIRVSIGEPSYPASDNGNTPGMNATLPQWPSAANSSQDQSGPHGSLNSINDWSRAISNDGSTIIFITPERLQADDVDGGAAGSCFGGGGCDVYQWHDGAVSMVSEGLSAKGVSEYFGMSASGSDVFFLAPQALVGQDTDQLQDLYDARIDGGLASQNQPPSATAGGCAGGEACQGPAFQAPAATTPGSSTFSGPGNEPTPPAKKKHHKKKHHKKSKHNKKTDRRRATQNDRGGVK